MKCLLLSVLLLVLLLLVVVAVAVVLTRAALHLRLSHWSKVSYTATHCAATGAITCNNMPLLMNVLLRCKSFV